jgi:long-chain fatty acid transport protein
MKKLILFSMLFVAANAYAQMDNLSNMSAEWMRTGARNAATNGTDIAVYNPAGLTSQSAGIHINVSNQSMFRSPSHTYDLGLGEGEKTFTQEGSDPFLPAMYLSFNKNNWAVFGGIYMAGGGATMNYSSGSITTDLISMQALMGAGGAYMTSKDQNLKASSMYLTYMAGAAYSVSKNISFSLALRNISAKNKAEGGITLTTSPFDLPDMPLAIDYEETANGMGAVIGFNVSCNENLNFSGRYESEVKLDFKTKQLTDDFGITTDGEMNRRDLPAVAAIGASYRFSSKVRTYYDFNYYFQEQADWGTTTIGAEEKSLSSLAGDAYGIGAGIEYSISPKFMASLGGGFSKFMYTDKPGYYTHLGSYEVMYDSNSNINTGIAFQASQKIKINAGYMHTFWAKDQNIKALIAQPMDVDVKVNNSMNAIAFGVEIGF